MFYLSSQFVTEFKCVGQKYKQGSDDLRCRYYENQCPEPEEFVMASVIDINDLGVYVTLLEYDDIKVIFLLTVQDIFFCSYVIVLS